jgi:hypothetical protein
MPAYVPSFKTVYDKPIIQPPKSIYGRNIVLIGLANGGPYYNPTYVPTFKEAKRQFVGGPLVDAFEEAYETGAKAIYLVRLKNLNAFDLQKVFDVLLDYEMHIIVPLGIYFEDEYPVNMLGNPVDEALVDSTPLLAHAYKRYASLFVDHCKLKQSFGGECIVIMSTRRFPSDFDQQQEDEEVIDFRERIRSQVDARVSELFNDQIARKGFGEAGYFLSVIFAEAMVFEGTERQRYTDCTALYAGLLSTVEPGHSPINKALKPVSRLRYPLYSATRQETLNFAATPICNLGRRPIEGTVKVFDFENPQGEYFEDVDFTVDYIKSTIVPTGNFSYVQDQLYGTYVLDEETGSMVEIDIDQSERIANNLKNPTTDPTYVKYYEGRYMPSDVIVYYKSDDRDSLASVGFVTMTDYVKAGPAFASSVTMSKNTISLVQDIRIMQSIASHIREMGSEFIGNTNISLDYLDENIDKYLVSLIESNQLIEASHTIVRDNGGKDLLVDVEMIPREAVLVQTLRIRLPLTI